MVATVLYKQYEDEVYYYHNGIEIDFIIPEKKIAIQVSYSIRDFDTRKREVEALSKFSKQFDFTTYLIITKDDTEEEIQTDCGITIQSIPLLKWLKTQAR
jgi:predicted AAA+ superfamily ATPase